MALVYTDLVEPIRSARSLMQGAAVAGARPAAIVASKGLLNVLQEGVLASSATAITALAQLGDFIFKNNGATIDLIIGLDNQLPFRFVAATTYTCEPLLAVHILKVAAAAGATFNQVLTAEYISTGVVQTFLG